MRSIQPAAKLGLPSAEGPRAEPNLQDGFAQMTCPAEEVILRFIAKEASDEERLRVVRHLIMCRECRELTAMIARFWKLSEERAE